MGESALGGDLGQQHETARLCPLAHHGRVAFVARARAPIPHGFDGTRRVLTRTASAVRRSFCHSHHHVVIGGLTGTAPRGRILGIRLTDLRVRFRHPHDRLEPLSRGVYCPSQPRQSPFVLGRGMHDNGPIGLAIAGHLALRRFIAGGRTMLGGARGRQEADVLPAIARDRLLDAALPCRISGGSAANAQGIPQRRQIVRGDQGRLRHVDIRSWGHAVAGQDGGDRR
jgi:hypothetical protein